MTLETLIKPKYDMPQKITYGGLPKRTDVYSQVFDTYCPVLSLDDIRHSRQSELGYDDIPRTVVHKLCAEAKEREDQMCPHVEPIQVPDPDVLFVGRLLDGLTEYQVFDSRKLAKNLINNITAGRTFREPGIAGQFTGGGVVNMWFKAKEPRAEMYEALEKGVFSGSPQIEELIRNGIAPTIAIGTVVKDAEPGEILNSPTVVDIQQEGEVDMWEAGLTESTWVPKIRLDRRYGLHYLKRGDEITISGSGWPRPRIEEFEHRWVLRPRSEGASLVQQDAGGHDVIQLSNQRA
jgi:hypothetical protein